MKLRLSALVLLLVLWATPAFSQGCAMCYNSATATTQGGQRALSRAVIVLLLPPVGFMTVGLGLALRFARKRDREAARDQEI